MQKNAPPEGVRIPEASHHQAAFNRHMRFRPDRTPRPRFCEGGNETAARSEPEQHGSPGQAAAESGQQHIVAFGDAAGAKRFIKAEPDRRGRGVAVTADIHEDTFIRNAEAGRCCFRN